MGCQRPTSCANYCEGKQATLAMRQGAGWVPQLDWMLWERENIFSPWELNSISLIIQVSFGM